MAEVRSHEGESLENALRRFKRKVQTEDIIRDVRSLLLPEGRRKAASEASFGAKACSKEESQRAELGYSGTSAVDWKRQLARYWPQLLTILTILGTLWLYFAFAPEAN